MGLCIAFAWFLLHFSRHNNFVEYILCVTAIQTENITCLDCRNVATGGSGPGLLELTAASLYSADKSANEGCLPGIQVGCVCVQAYTRQYLFPALSLLSEDATVAAINFLLSSTTS